MLFNIILQGGAGAPAGQGGIGQFLPLLLIMAVFFFFMIWPQMRKQKKAKAYLAEIGKGDKVVTTGGIHAKIAAVGETTFVLELEEGKIKVEKAAISMEMTMAAYPKAKAD